MKDFRQNKFEMPGFYSIRLSGGFMIIYTTCLSHKSNYA